MEHAYAYDGSQLALETINKNFNMDIENFITIDFTGFERVIDAIGGVEIELSPDEASHINMDDCGRQLLDGEKALEYSRIRMIGNGDYERTEGQRRVQALNLANEIIRSRIKNVEQFRIPADGYAGDKKINRIFYVVPDTLEDNITLLKNFIYGDEDNILNN